MSKSLITTVTAFTLALPLMAGCEKKADTAPTSAAASAPATPEAPAAPEPVAAVVDGAQAQAQPAAGAPAKATPPAPAASASVGPGGVEAAAGDVSVKLPN